jgi:hypothetical protein
MSWVPPLRITPSTITSGPCERPLALSDLGPRSTIDGAVPGRPLGITIWAPGTLPWSDASALDDGTGMSASFTVVTVNGSFFCSVAPVTPVTTISDKRLMSRLRTKSCVCVPAVILIGKFCAVKPIARARSIIDCPRTRSAGMMIWYRPWAFAMTETFISVMYTLATSMTLPCSEVMRPVMVALCAWAEELAAVRNKARVRDVRRLRVLDM